jgi:hypothetical protein
VDGTKTEESGSLSTSTESYSLTNLQSNTEYTVSVQAETEHATSEDVALTFDVGPNETIQKDSIYVVSDTEKVAGTLQILDYE